MGGLLVELWLLVAPPYSHSDDRLLLSLAYWLLRVADDSVRQGQGAMVTTIAPAALYLSMRQVVFLSGQETAILYLSGIYIYLPVEWVDGPIRGLG